MFKNYLSKYLLWVTSETGTGVQCVKHIVTDLLLIVTYKGDNRKCT